MQTSTTRSMPSLAKDLASGENIFSIFFLLLSVSFQVSLCYFLLSTIAWVPDKPRVPIFFISSSFLSLFFADVATRPVTLFSPCTASKKLTSLSLKNPPTPPYCKTAPPTIAPARAISVHWVLLAAARTAPPVAAQCPRLW